MRKQHHKYHKLSYMTNHTPTPLLPDIQCTLTPAGRSQDGRIVWLRPLQAWAPPQWPPDGGWRARWAAGTGWVCTARCVWTRYRHSGRTERPSVWLVHIHLHTWRARGSIKDKDKDKIRFRNKNIKKHTSVIHSSTNLYMGSFFQHAKKINFSSTPDWA